MTEVTRTTITVRRFDNQYGDAYLPPEFQKGDPEVKAFRFSPSLVAGKGPDPISVDYRFSPPIRVALSISPEDSYLPIDVCVGDRVRINYSRIDGVDICDRICILRRPGGEVPPAHGERVLWAPRWHEVQNARQALEDGKLLSPEFEKLYPKYADELYEEFKVKRRVRPPVAPDRIPIAR